MQWTRPEFTEITLGGEVTAYVNVDDVVSPTDERPLHTESRGDADMPHETSV